MEHLSILRRLYDLKTVYRDIPIQNKYESSAEHSWSTMLLADYFMEKLGLQLDRLKVFELLIYHDLPELETGDISLADTEARKNKKEAERHSMESISATLPPFMREKYRALYEEFVARQTPESKFANAMDKFDAQLQCFNTPEGDVGRMKEAMLPYSEGLLREKRSDYFVDYPEVNEAFEYIIQHFKEMGYL